MVTIEIWWRNSLAQRGKKVYDLEPWLEAASRTEEGVEEMMTLLGPDMTEASLALAKRIFKERDTIVAAGINLQEFALWLRTTMGKRTANDAVDTLLDQ